MDYQESIFSTATNGHIVVSSDGESYSITTDVRLPEVFEFAAAPREVSDQELASLTSAMSSSKEATADKATAELVSAGLPPLPVEIGTRVQVVTRDSATVSGILKDLNKEGWIGLLEETTTAVAYVRASEILVVKQLPSHQ